MTTDHARIRSWIEAHGGHPAMGRDALGDAPPPLRIDFPGYTDAEALDPVSWDAFFRRFDAERLAFVHQVDADDAPEEPPFFQFVPRDCAHHSTAGGTT